MAINIFNPTTGQTGYQVPGASLQPGWIWGTPPVSTATPTPTPSVPTTPTPPTAPSVSTSGISTPVPVGTYLPQFDTTHPGGTPAPAPTPSTPAPTGSFTPASDVNTNLGLKTLAAGQTSPDPGYMIVYNASGEAAQLNQNSSMQPGWSPTNPKSVLAPVSTPTTTQTPPASTATPTPTTAVPTTVLQPGATGDTVKALQDYLVSKGYMTAAQVATGPGIYGPQTTAAVLALQKALGIDNSSGPGYFGPKTIAALQGSTGGSTATPALTSLQTQLGNDQALLAKATALGYGPNDTIQTDSQGNILPPNSTSSTKPTQQSLTDILKSAGLNIDSNASISDIITQLSTAYGLTDINDRISALTDKYASDVQNINDDPWISEGIRLKKVASLKASFDLANTNLQNTLKNEQTIVGQAITLYDAQQTNARTALTAALTAQTALANTQTTDMKNYNYSVSQGYTGTFEQWQAEQANLKIPTIKTPTSTSTIKVGTGTTVVPTVTKPLTTAQINTGVANSGLSLSDYKALDLTTQGYFSQNSADIKNSKTDIETALKGGKTLEDVQNSINSNSSYPPGVRKYYSDYANTYASTNNLGTSGGTFGNPFAGGSNPVANFFNNLF